ncbi:MAG: hypothetical protein AAB443_00865 [Patescibacteria group bacterium]
MGWFIRKLIYFNRAAYQPSLFEKVSATLGVLTGLAFTVLIVKWLEVAWGNSLVNFVGTFGGMFLVLAFVGSLVQYIYDLVTTHCLARSAFIRASFTLLELGSAYLWGVMAQVIVGATTLLALVFPMLLAFLKG